jgi:chaperone required for assembly of F1-ATPase
MSGAKRKRVYRSVAVEPHGTGFGVTLDGKLMHTPQRRALILPTRKLADAIAAEWHAQAAEIDPLSMPLTRLAGSAHDQVAPHRADLIERTAAYGATDLLCYRAASPPDLVARQALSWQPLVDWAAARYGAALAVTSGVRAIPQPARTLAALKRAVEGYDDLRLTAVAAATAACGSLVLALALAEGRIDGAAAWALSLLDETFQMERWGQTERWGENPELAQSRAALKADIEAAGRFLALLAE